MTRSHELRRIESAIQRRDQQELRRAAAYCQQRIAFVLMKAGASCSRQDGASRWRKIEKRVLAARDQDHPCRVPRLRSRLGAGVG
jgi:hypothetical protein